MRLTPALLALALVTSCRRGPSDTQRSGQVQYDGRPLADWWQLRRDPDPEVERQAATAMRVLGAAAVPFLAQKVASNDLGDVIGGSVALENMCPSAIPGMEAARSDHPSAAIDGAIRRVRENAAEAVRRKVCTPAGEPVRPEDRRQ